MPLTVAIIGDPLLQLPPDAVSDKVTDVPSQNVEVPEIVPATGNGFTVIVRVAELDPQLFDTVYEISELPADTPVTTPPAVIVATPVETLNQVPPPTVGVRVTCAPTQTTKVPFIVPAAGLVITVTILVAAATPQPLETV